MGQDRKRLWAEVQAKVQANSARLEGCKRHRFDYSTVKLGQRLKCTHCGGELQLTDAGTYVKGYIAAGGNAEDVWPGWNRRRG